ncbi:tripartite tricarboxylate transporter TctB family protein [Salibacterium aidingense]|uniref:tripartite tricarboxylate transporter TctB family protein n=1 Tax=Salibacterium aidingense TaxID=384933 RepID=UPI003BDDE5D6
MGAINNPKNRESIIGMVMILISVIFFFWSGVNFESHFLVPYIALAGMFIAGVITLWKGVKISKQSASESNKKTGLGILEIVSIIVFLFVATWLMERLGFYFTMAILLFVFHVYLSKRNKKVNWLKSLAFALITIFVTYLIFNNLLEIRAPSDTLLF